MAAVASLISYNSFPLQEKPNSPGIRCFSQGQRKKKNSSPPSKRNGWSRINGLGNDSNQNTARDEEVKDIGVRVALSLLRFYKREISPVLPSSCRYVPTCSEYSMEAYKRYGVAKGTVLTAWRLCRCNPLGGSGFDPPRWFGERRPPEE